MKSIQNVGEAVATEFLTEFVQADPAPITNFWGRAELNGQGIEGVLTIFLIDLGETTREGLYQGAVAVTDIMLLASTANSVAGPAPDRLHHLR